MSSQTEERTNFAAWVESSTRNDGGPLVVRPAEVWKAQPGELIIKVEAIGFNPSDWKSVYARSLVFPLPLIQGSDVVGIVEEIGEGVDGFVIGDRVAGYTPFQFGALRTFQGLPAELNRHGAFQQRVAVFPRGVFKIPSSIPIEEAATFGCAYATAALAFWDASLLGYTRPPSVFTTSEVKQTPETATAKSKTLLVWGGSSAIGAYAVQFAHLSGIRVVTTASPRHFAYLESLGAAAVYDYRDPDIVAKLAAEDVDRVFDTIAEEPSLELVKEILQGKVGVKVVVTLNKGSPRGQSIGKEFPDGVIAVAMSVPEIFDEEHEELMKWLYHDFTPNYFIAGVLKASRPLAFHGGLELAYETMLLQKNGQVSGQKPVLRLV